MDHIVRERTRLNIPSKGRLLGTVMICAVLTFFVFAYGTFIHLKHNGYLTQVSAGYVTPFFSVLIGSKVIFFLPTFLGIIALMCKLIHNQWTRTIRSCTDYARKIARGEWGIEAETPDAPNLLPLVKELNILSKQMARAIETSEKGSNSLERINRINQILMTNNNPEEIVEILLDNLAQLFPGDKIALLIDNPEKRGMDFFPSSMKSLGQIESSFFTPLSRFPSNRDKRFLLYQVPYADLPRENKDFIEGLPIKEIGEHTWKAYINIPLQTSHTYVGTLCILSRGWDDNFAETIRNCTPQLSQAAVFIQRLKDMQIKEHLHTGVLTALTRTVDAKSQWTAGHSDRVAKLAEELARPLFLAEKNLKELNTAALLHDVGKIGIPEAILDKPGKLTAEERAEIEYHPVLGGEILKDLPAYNMIRKAVLHHHERWDGSGYPQGLKAGDIPLFSRILAIADVFDALTSPRPYRKALSHTKALAIIKEGRGKLFDPYLTDIFLENQNKLSRPRKKASTVI